MRRQDLDSETIKLKATKDAIQQLFAGTISDCWEFSLDSHDILMILLKVDTSKQYVLWWCLISNYT